MIEDLKRAAAFTDVRERLGKLVPRLASDHQGEVVATVAAIGRTLAGAGLDWHDLAKRIATPTSFDAMTSGAAPPRPPQDPDPAPGPTWTPPKPTAPAKPRREPRPWPTWGTLSHFGRLGMFEHILAGGALPEGERPHFEAVRDVYRRQQTYPSTRDQRVFNAACRGLWEMGWRPKGKAA